MKPWAQDILVATSSATTTQTVFDEVASAARKLGFSHCAYGLRTAVPITKPRVVMINDYPTSWQKRYAEAGYYEVDPTVQHVRQSPMPIVWSDMVFAGTPALWSEAQASGLRIGWAQSSLDGYGAVGMLTLARNAEQLSRTELLNKELQMRWLVSIAHLAFNRLLQPQLNLAPKTPLTLRETEVLKWMADGKTSSDVSEILAISEETVKFHTKNAILKLGVRNRVSAVARSALLGLLS